VIETLGLFLIFAALLAVDISAAAARAAYQESSYARLLTLREVFAERTNRAIALFHASRRVLASISVLLILVHFLLAGWILFVLYAQTAQTSWWQAGLVLLFSAFILFLLEHGVTSSVLHDPERSAVRLSLFTRLVMILMTPLTTVAFAVSRDAAGQSETASAVTEDELKTLVDAGQKEGLLEQGERRMIYSVIELGDTLAREIMVPRIDMLALEVASPLAEAIDILVNTGHSRVPVYEGAIDNMLGLLYAKDLLRIWQEGRQLETLRGLLRPTYFIPETKKVDDLLREMQSQRIHLAMVVDEYGGIAGLVTLEDIVEEILGEIRDEYDQAEELPYQTLKNGDTLFQGRIDLDDFNEIMGSDLSKEEADTLGGYIYSQLGHVPEVGETVKVDNLYLVVEQVSARRIRKVRARWVLAKEESEKDDEQQASG
jgi:putative hemolysin